MRVTEDGTVTGLAYWFTLHLCGDIILETGPACTAVSLQTKPISLFDVQPYDFEWYCVLTGPLASECVHAI